MPPWWKLMEGDFIDATLAETDGGKPKQEASTERCLQTPPARLSQTESIQSGEASTSVIPRWQPLPLCFIDCSLCTMHADHVNQMSMEESKTF